MSYSGNMPDWHQYNPPQGRATSTSHPQNVNSSHPFISSITPPTLEGLNLSERQPKHQRNDVYQRNYQNSGIPPNCPTSTTLTTPGGVHMSPLPNCVSHYGSSSSRTSMIDPPLDPRLGLNDNEMHRNNQMPFNPPTNHTNTNLTVNPNLHAGSITSQTSPVAPLSPGRQSYSCKLPCCNPDGMPYQHWEKYGPYQSNPSYRDNRTSNYQMENRRFAPDLNLRKDCIENKEMPGFDRRNYDYKYRKDMRNYPGSGLLPNYQMKNYNLPDYQKCPHSVKDYMRRGTSINQNPGLMKYDQMPPKYNKLSYQNGNQPGVNTSTASLSSPLQNSYFSAPITRDVSREFPREYQEGTGTRMQANPTMLHGGYQKYHVYQQKIAMQRFSLENHLRAMARVPGYQSHPKYQEYVMRYRELLRLQQNVDYQTFLQDPSKMPTSPTVPPINLQFDQNGCLINSSYSQGPFSGIHNPINPVNPDVPEVATAQPVNPLEQNHYNHQEQLHHVHNEVPEYQMPENQSDNFENMIVDVDSIDPTRTITSATNTMSTTTAPSDDVPKEFADKPQLDVRQFLANWDETEEEEGNGNTPEVSSNTSNTVIVHNIPEVPSNNVESSPKEQETVEKSPDSVEKPTDVDGLKAIEFSDSGAVVQCIQTDSSDIPTIHIVDHLPEASELATISTVYGDVTSLSIEQIAAAPIEIMNENEDAGETITLFGQDTGVCSKEPESSSGSEEAVEEVGSMLKTPENVTPVEPKESHLSPPQEVAEATQKSQTSETTHLRKQHSFASEESHNPDDISLPDLPMSECTPISTTLNTPIHSDSEESSGHVADLAISTNPIEIIQNSPIISFTHSPIKIDPYSNIENGRLSEKPQHESLDFDFTENSKKTEVENYEIARRSDNLDKSKSPEEKTEKSDKSEFYPCSDPLVGMSPKDKMKKTEIDSSNDITNVGECSGVPGTPVSRILSTDEIDTGKCPSIIDTEDFQQTDDLDKLCNISLDSSCMMPLIPEDSQEQRLTSEIDNMKNVMPITNLEELESSDELEKEEWVEVRSMDEEPNVSVNEMLITLNESPSVPPLRKESEDNKKGKYIRSIFDTSEDSQSTGFDEFMRRKKEELKRDDKNPGNDKIHEISNKEDKSSRKNETCKITQSFRRTHKDTDVEIRVANINVEKLYDSASEATDAIEIKINVSRHDKKFRIKSIEQSEEKSESKKFGKTEKFNYCPQKIFPRRRISNPEESKKSKREIRRRHSGTYRYRKSIEERVNEIRSKNITKYELPVKLFDKEETSEPSFSEGPVSSHDDTANTCDSQETEESALENPELCKIKNFTPDFDELETMASKSCQLKAPEPEETPGPSTTSQTDDTWNKLNFFDVSMDFDNFDVAPNENLDVRDDFTSSTLTEDRALSRRLEECEKYRNPYSKTPDNDALEVDLNTVPVYTTKDGKIKYSPNPRYTYRVLIMEAREREGNFRDFIRDHKARVKRREKSWSECNSMRKSSRRLDDSSWRSNRCSKYDRWRERPPEVESEDPSVESTKSNKFLGSRNDRFDDLMIPNRKSSFSFDEERAEDSLMIGCINNLTVASNHDLLRSEVQNNSKSIEVRIFNGDELELFSRKEVVEMIEEKGVMKPPESVDLEQDSQMLTDSGLESSTTYTEGSKEPRRCSIWQRGIISEKFEETPVIISQREIKLSKNEEEIVEERNEEARRDKLEEVEIEKIPENKEEKIETDKLTQFLSRNYSNNYESSTLKGLDLAFPIQQIYKAKIVDNKNEDVSNSSGLSTKKVEPPRRASSDEVREEISFYANKIKFPESTKNLFSEGIKCLGVEHHFEKPEVPSGNLLKSFVAPARKVDVETPEISTESEISQLDETLSSTQFGSEFAAGSSGLNFLSTSSQEAVDATDLKGVRKDLALCALSDKSESENLDNLPKKNEEKVLKFSSESEDDSNAQDGSPIGIIEVDKECKNTEDGEKRILNFSGKIQSPEAVEPRISSPLRIHVSIEEKTHENSLNFTGKIPSPKASEFSPKSDDKLENDEKNLTFSGKIGSKSPTTFDKIPKFIIKKTDSSRSSSISQILPSDISLHPKIPKMIIRNVRSRPGTPTIEENAVELSFPKNHESDSEKVFEVKIKLDEPDTIRKSLVPKMRIKLEEKNSRMTFETASTELSESSELFKNVPKVKIRKIRRFEKSLDSSPERHSEKIPKLKIMKQEQRVASLSPEPSKRKRAKTPENFHKKAKKSNRHRSLESRGNSKSLPLDLDSMTSTTLSEKIPKVIIKRATSTSEFKCELSKDGGESIMNSKWQPEVKLQRFEVLDSIAKQGRVVPLKLLEEVSRLSDTEGLRSSRKLKRTSSDPSRCDRSERSSSRGRRRYSDPEKPSSHCHLPVNPQVYRGIEDESVEARSGFSSISRIDDKTVTRSEFEYPNVISSQKLEIVPALTGENANDAIDTKSSEEQSVIKLDSSDESQTTIELLPVSSDISQPESEVPTPLEAERRIANGDMARVYSSDAIPTQFELELEIVDNSEGSLEVPVPGVESKGVWDSDAPGPSFRHETYNNEAKSICSSDSLVKDVLAAKETLKRYLTTSKHVKTPGEKKLFSGDKVPLFSGKEGNKGNVFQKGVGTNAKGKEKRAISNSDKISSRDFSSRGVKRTKEGEGSSKKMRPLSKRESSQSGSSSFDTDRRKGFALPMGKEEKKTREIMPILEPEGTVDFESNQRDPSRSPPVITKQDSEVLPESPKKIEVNVSEKIEGIEQESEAMTFADIVAKMAYHEKATIKHRRYCILCERWFPTTARHRRHLSGYQHRHTELTQRRTVHALFMLFTGKPCPRLLPASIVRTDCAPGEPTPLQIAVQDVAISLEKAAIDKTKRTKEEDE